MTEPVASPVICARCHRLLGYESATQLELGADQIRFVTSVRYICPCGHRLQWSKPKDARTFDNNPQDAVGI